MTATAHAPARTSSVVIVTPHEIVTVGLRAILAAESASLRFLPPETEEVPDNVLYDVVALLDDDGSTLDHWVREVGATVLALTRPLRPDLGTRALLLGAAAALP